MVFAFRLTAPSLWTSKYPACGGNKQSPINIETDKVIVDKKLKPFIFDGLKSIDHLRLLLENNGHTAKVTVGSNNPKDSIISVLGGPLHVPYIVEQFHFHWGSRDGRGSEHSINGRFFPMEMHIVTYSSTYSSFLKAYKKPKGLAVLSFMFEIGQDNPAFQEIIKHMKNIKYKDGASFITSFSLTALFPRDSYVYYTYPGSLTTPGCYESVVWSIFMNKITISERQIHEYRKLCEEKSKGSHHLVNNYRPVQELDTRVVRTNDPRGKYTPPVNSGHSGNNRSQKGKTPHQPLLNPSKLTSGHRAHP